MENVVEFGEKYRSLVETVAEKVADKLDWYKKTYESDFAPYFSDVEALYARLNSDTRAITDEELMQILVDIPLKLYQIAELLNAYRLESETLKLESKRISKDIKRRDSNYSKKELEQLRQDDPEGLQIEFDYLACNEALITHIDSEVVKITALIQRVELQISFTRELIMSAKKIWTARQEATATNPVSEVDDLPEYSGIISEDVYIQ